MKEIFIVFIFIVYGAFVAFFASFMKNIMGFRTKRAFWLLFLLNFLLNIAGFIFTLILYFYLQRAEKRKCPVKTQKIDTDVLSFSFPQIRFDYRKGALKELLIDSNVEEERKVKVLSYLKNDLKKEDMQLFHSILSSRSDESRLLSFGVINRMEKELNDKIGEIIEKVEKIKDKRELFKEYKKLSQLYYEYVHYEIATGDLKKFYLKKAEESALEAFEIDSENEELYMILGKIYFRQKEYEKAESYFKNIENYFLRKRVLAYLAEIYFERGESEKFREILKELKEIKYNPKVFSLISLWR